jgi:hypothetical protein
MENTAPKVIVLPVQFLPPDVVVVVATAGLVVVVAAAAGLVVVVVAIGGLLVVVVGALVVLVVAGRDVAVVVGATENVEEVVAWTDDGVGLLEHAARSNPPRASATPTHVRRTG